MRAAIVLLILMTLLITFPGCRPAAVNSPAIETQMAADVFHPVTASIPTIGTPPTLEPSPTPIPTVIALVQAATLEMYGIPDLYSPAIDSFVNKDKVNVVGQYKDCIWLLVKKADGKQGWILSGEGSSKITVYCSSIPVALFRPPNGFYIEDARFGSGLGTLTVDNGRDSDGVVALVDGFNKVVISFYLRSRDTLTLSKVPDGNYYVYFEIGKDWNWEKGSFNTVQEMSKFDNILTFTTGSTAYSTYSLTLHPVAGGTARTINIDPASFPSLK
jgi:hypothetical protein